MTPFSLLQETPRPYLDPAELKAKFLKLSAPLHPDRVHHLSIPEREEATRRFAELNRAYLALREPKERIDLLLEMETGSKPKDIQKIPPGTMDLFVEVGQFCRDLDAHLAGLNPAETSLLLKTMAARQKEEWLNRFQGMQSKVDAKREAVLEELKKLDEAWVASSERKNLLEPLENAARLFSYIARWSQQLGERSIQLKLS